MACAALMLSACSATPPPAPAADALARDYVELTRQLARHDPSLIDHWLREPPPLTGTRQPVQPLAERVATLRAGIDRATAAETSEDTRFRLRHLAGQARALRQAAARLLGAEPTFDEEALEGLGLVTARADAAAVAGAREQVAAAVAGAREQVAAALPGEGTLAARLAAFRRRFVIPEHRREAVMRSALEVCRVAVATALPLPADEAIEVVFVPALPWDAHARYLGHHRTRVEIHGGQPLDLTRALRLACHEGPAGHHAQYIWTSDHLIDRRGWTEFALVPGFGPDLLLAEGAAEAGTDLAMPAARRLDVYRTRLAPAAGLPATDLDRLVRVEDAVAALEPLIGDLARDYLDNRLTATLLTERLADEALIASPDSFIPFIEQRRTRLLAYADGRRVVLAQLAGQGLAALPTLFLP
jgi:hypothetical protein